MLRLLCLVIVYFLTVVISFAQGTVASPSQKRLFLDGIHICNSNVTIPWGIHFDDISNYGAPTVSCSNKYHTKVQWLSVKILDSLDINLHCFYFYCFQKRKPSGALKSMYGIIESLDLPKYKSYLEEYSGSSGILKKLGSSFIRQWEIDNCRVMLGVNKSNESFLYIVTKTVWK
jgi:hypothetical protein